MPETNAINGLFCCGRGNFAVGLALLAPLVLGAAGGVVDLLVYGNHLSQLQETADAAVMAAATEASLKGWDAEIAATVVKSVVEAHLGTRFSEVTFDERVEVDQQRRRIELELTQDHYGYFYLGYFTGSPQIKVVAVAAASGQSDICVIVQSPDKAGALKLTGNASVAATGCSAYSNSKHVKGIEANGGSRLSTELACSGGGYSGGAVNYRPIPLTDCPPIPDPLARRAETIATSISTACSFSKMEIKNTTKSLLPGTYCNGLKISKGATARLSPGVYVIKDGPLKVDQKATIQGEGVSLVFVGEKAGLELKNDSTVSLSAPSEGVLAGILVHAAALGATARTFKIESKNARKFTGTVHLPADKLVVGGDRDGDGVCDIDLEGEDDEDEVEEDDPSAAECESDVGSASAWTAIIARELEVTKGVNLVINADYDATTVPVPEGLGPTSSKIFLAR